MAEKTREELMKEKQAEIDALNESGVGIIQEVGIGRGLSDTDLKPIKDKK